MRNGRYERKLSFSVLNSSGFGTTKVSFYNRIDKVAGVTAIRIQTRSCSYDASRGIYRTCSAWIPTVRTW